MLDKLFLDLRANKNSYLNARKGNEFEERIGSFLKLKLGLTPILKEDVIDPKTWNDIKHHIHKGKLEHDFIDISDSILKRTFIYQPYGSQDFPDFLVFTDKKIIPLEIKFTTKSQKSPIWNSNVPRANAFYIFGSYGLKDITFFCGNDVLSSKHRELLYKFFVDIKVLEHNIRKEMPALDETNRGFTPYIRAAFAQKKHKPEVEVNFFTFSKRKEIEDLAIEKAKLL